MGEIADQIIGDMLDPPEFWWSEPEDFGDAGLRLVTCRYCKRRNLQWAQRDGTWRLQTSKGAWHHCAREARHHYEENLRALEEMEKAGLF